VNQSRRQSLRIMAGAAALPALALGWPRLGLGSELRFDPPSWPMRLSRTLVRDLPDGAEILVKRIWAVVFQPVEEGFTLSGQQTSIQVETPPSLKFLAQMEEQRAETGLFPMDLSAGGMIAAGVPRPNSEMFDRAVSAVARQIDRGGQIDGGGQIDRGGLSADDTRLTAEALSALQKSAAELTSKLPRDLFHPVQPHWQIDRSIVLPGGLSGSVTVTFDARMDATRQLMEHSERRIVSSIGGTSRTSTERWELARM